MQLFNRDFYEKHKTAVADYMRAQLHAFYYCASHKSQCINIEQHFATASGSEYQTQHETDEWNLEATLALDHTLPGKGVGVESTAEWQPEANALVDYDVVKKLPPLSRYEDSSLVAGLYNGKTLTWP